MNQDSNAYRYKCHRINHTHLCFADDLLIFSKGSLDSILRVKSTIEQFSEFSELRLNAAKFELFVVGLDGYEHDIIHACTGFKIDRFYVKYIGVPLVTKKLTEKDYQPLIGKIKARLERWFVKQLSYAGRLQLINFVLLVKEYIFKDRDIW
ncbi:hypothetical protein GQ457_18G002900 [Hibiscus cannabinus]